MGALAYRPLGRSRMDLWSQKGSSGRYPLRSCTSRLPSVFVCALFPNATVGFGRELFLFCSVLFFLRHRGTEAQICP